MAIWGYDDGEMFHEACTKQEDRKDMNPVSLKDIPDFGICAECGRSLVPEEEEEE